MRTLIAFVAVIGMASAITMQVEPHREECVYETLDAREECGFSYQVTAGGFLDVDVRIYAPDESVVHSEDRETEGRVTFKATQQGSYRFCFSNKMSTLTPKSVSFSIEPSNDAGGVASREDLGNLERSLAELSDGLSQIRSEQNYMRMRERAHRSTSESTNARVLWWAVFEGIAMLAMSGFQVYTLRKFFEVRRVV